MTEMENAMDARTRKEHIAAIVARISRAAKALGVEPPAGFEYVCEFGSKTNGIGFAFHWRNVETGALYKVFGMDSFLGFTYAEAEAHLFRIADTLEAVYWHKQHRGQLPWHS